MAEEPIRPASDAWETEREALIAARRRIEADAATIRERDRIAEGWQATAQQMTLKLREAEAQNAELHREIEKIVAHWSAKNIAQAEEIAAMRESIGLKYPVNSMCRDGHQAVLFNCEGWVEDACPVCQAIAERG